MAIFNDGGRNMWTENNLIVDAPVAVCGNAATVDGNQPGWIQNLKDAHWRKPPYSTHYPYVLEYTSNLEMRAGAGCQCDLISSQGYF